MKTKPQDTQDWIHSHHTAAISAVDTIKAASRATHSSYATRVRILELFARNLRAKIADRDQLELFDPDAILTPEVARFLAHPLAGLE
jgi:hypothetical protein